MLSCMSPCAILYNVIAKNNLLYFKTAYNKKQFLKLFGMNMTFISSSEAKK